MADRETWFVVDVVTVQEGINEHDFSDLVRVDETCRLSGIETFSQIVGLPLPNVGAVRPDTRGSKRRWVLFGLSYQPAS
jgi:hypothetical protein